MKKITMFLTLAAVSAILALSGAETSGSKAAVQQEESWIPFQLVFFPGFPAGAKNSNVHGLKLGVPATGGYGNIKGIEASFFFSGTSFHGKNSSVQGFQGSWFGPVFAEDVYGLQATQTFGWAKSVTGMQAGPFVMLKENSCGVQAAGGGVAMKDFDGFQAGAANITCGNFNGFQFGAANIAVKECNGFQCGAFALAGDATGCQINLVNVITKLSKAFQMGVVNYSNNKGIQFGAVNIIKGGVVPVMIIFNCSL